jgi:hypothetical protein
VLALALAAQGCSSDAPPPETDDLGPAPILEGSWYRPTAATTWQWQLVESVNTEYAVDVYDIDLYNVSEAEISALQGQGRVVICYFSAGSFEPFRPDSGDFPTEVIGKILDGFEDENWLDVRQESVLEIMRKRLDLAAQKGCDGVEPDNVDGYQNDTGFPLADSDQLVFNKKLANEAHMRGLSVGLKNDLEQISRLSRYFDFSVNEQCHEFDECEALLAFVSADKPVWNAEYQQDFVDDPASICPTSLRLNLRTLILPLDLDDTFRITCD